MMGIKIKIFIFLLVSIVVIGFLNIKREKDHKSNVWEGVWTGPVYFQENNENPQCIYDGIVTLELPESQKSPSFVLDLTDVIEKGYVTCWLKQKFPPINIDPIINSQTIKWVDRIVVFEGSLDDSNTLKLEFESCPNNQCLDGVRATGVKGTGTLKRK